MAAAPSKPSSAPKSSGGGGGGSGIGNIIGTFTLAVMSVISVFRR